MNKNKYPVQMKQCLKAYHHAKSLRKHFRIQKWKQNRIDIMKQLLLLKFCQNKSFRKKLLSTNNDPLEEDNPKDSFWALGNNHQGHNHLGFLLMELRELCFVAESLLDLNPANK